MIFTLLACQVAKSYLVFEGSKGNGMGRQIVFLAGDEEYRSEEGLPMLARQLASRFGFRCVVSFSINGKGEIDPTVKNNQPGIEELDRADLCVMLLRFRKWPDEQMMHFERYFASGRPFIGLRTSTHAFDYSSDSASPYRKFDWQSKDWPGGFGKQVLGETWLSHWGIHGEQATRGLANSTFKAHPILRGVGPIFCDTDVYEVHPPNSSKVLMIGQVLEGMSPNSKAIQGSKNDPMMPAAWLSSYRHVGGKRNRSFTSTMGAATDLRDENLRRLIVNASLYLLDLEVPAKSDVSLDFPYVPSAFGFGKHRKGIKPSL